MSISTHLQVATANQDAKDQKLGVYSNSSFAHEAENNRIKNHRISTYSGNFFKDDFPPNCDGVLFINILHDWSIDRVKVLLDM